MIDIIVFTQKELDNAINNGCTVIALCDNNFRLPSVSDIHYIAIGKITASIELDHPEDYGIKFSNFSPKTKKRPKIVHVENKAVGTASLSSGSYSSSYGSYLSSYKRGSYSSSYGSYFSSYQTSYLYSYRYNYRFNYRSSFSGSYSSSYRLGGSYRSSFASSFKLTSFIHSFKRGMYDYILREISVNGYGIHLI
ncbi:MAG: hypothetical protein LIO59_05025 [Oscillospiraceae bacterium]|nr:hypothetical protein [Oscillospiraceae bacterium]